MSDDLWLIQKSTVEGIGDATREKLGITEEIPVIEIEDSIRAIPAQKPEQTKTLEVTANGIYTIEPDEGQVLTGVTVTEANPFQDKWKQLMNRTIKQITRDDVVGLTGYGKYVCGHCTALYAIVFPEHMTFIGDRAFYGCVSLGTQEHLVIPATIKEIGQHAFGMCTGLTQVSIRGKPNSIASNAFTGCSNLKHAYLGWGQNELPNSRWGLPDTCEIHWNYGS